MADNKKDKSAGKKNSFWTGVKQEWRKISWTNKEDLTKQTVLVVVISVLMGALITVVDSGALQLINWLLSI